MALKDKRQIGKNKSFFQSVGHALEGIRKLVVEERNFRFDLIITAVVLCVGIVLNLNIYDWLWLCAAFFSVIGSEVLNSIVENVVDLIVGHHFDLMAKRAKDIAAGGVLLSAFFAVIIGALIFIPRIMNLLNK
ncbi:diacylglycerol kinase family protein [Lentilactobacillus parafarraginis]|jgi:undecaprenol kinase|uniref:Undecaprenol kinase n=3 Tax=Lentilactobacillus parafarraginis TaxID=390842 RepID=A0A0R1YXF1_9LACO|nr:diacylglycerol kinase family protein [Lentilactobacillus parafarraginis]EHL95952.1 putative undecaprenol kinase [Lentilactobacillus parafarraginis F0439]KRM43644.1 undecaprenol kinase [Lentilactobacillus parafarraginis DSM 18390 = JCM 14109]TLQ21023.1 diacylglycerol kinase family protein [Lentilactobacillus parafarraginis]